MSKKSFNVENQFFSFLQKQADKKEKQQEKDEKLMEMRRIESENYRKNLEYKRHKKSDDDQLDNQQSIINQSQSQQNNKKDQKKKKKVAIKDNIPHTNNLETQNELNEFEKKQQQILNDEEDQEKEEKLQEEKYQKAQIQLIKNNHSLTEQQKEVKIKMLLNKGQQNNRVQNIFQKHQSKMSRKYQVKGKSDKFESHMKIFKDLDTYLETKGLIENMNELNQEQQHKIREDYAKLKVQETFQKYGKEMQMFMNKGANQEKGSFALQSNILNNLQVLQKAQKALKSQKKIKETQEEKQTKKIIKQLENDKKLFEKNPLEIQQSDNDIFFEKLQNDIKQGKLYQEQDKEHELDEHQIQMIQRQMNLYKLENKNNNLDDDEEKQLGFKKKANKVMSLLVKTTKNILKKKVSTLGEEAMTVEYQRQRRREKKQEALRETVEAQKQQLEKEQELVKLKIEKEKKKYEAKQQKIKQRKLALGLLSDEDLSQDVSDVKSDDLPPQAQAYEDMKQEMRRKSLLNRASGSNIFSLSQSKQKRASQNLNESSQKKNPNHKFERINEEDLQLSQEELLSLSMISSSKYQTSSDFYSKSSSDFEDSEERKQYMKGKMAEKEERKKQREIQKQREKARQEKLKKKKLYQSIHHEIRQQNLKDQELMRYKKSFGSDLGLKFQPPQKQYGLYATTSQQNLDSKINQQKMHRQSQNNLNQSEIQSNKYTSRQNNSRLQTNMSIGSINDLNNKINNSQQILNKNPRDILKDLGLDKGMSKMEMQKRLINLDQDESSLFDLTQIQEQKRNLYYSQKNLESQQKIQKKYQTMIVSTQNQSVQLQDTPQNSRRSNLKLPQLGKSSISLNNKLYDSVQNASKPYSSPKRHQSTLSPNKKNSVFHYKNSSPTKLSSVTAQDMQKFQKDIQNVFKLTLDAKQYIKEKQKELLPEIELQEQKNQKDYEQLKPQKLQSIRYVEKSSNHNDIFKANRNISKKSLKLIM